MSDLRPASGLLRLLLGALGANHPIRLAIGVSIGIFSKMLVDVLAIGAPSASFLNAISAYQTFWFVIVCAPLVFLPMIFGKRNAPEPVVHHINTIRALMDEAKLSTAQQRLYWMALLDKYIDAARPDLGGSPDLAELSDEPKLVAERKSVPLS